MKRILTLALFPFIFSACLGQEEGDVINGYMIEFEIQIETENQDIINRLVHGNYFGSTMRLFIANGYYRQEFTEGKQLESLFYNYHDNIQYSKHVGIDSIITFQCNEDPRVFFSQKKESEELEVLNYPCICSEIEAEGVKYKYCSSSELSMELDKFSKHECGFFNKMMKMLDGPYLYFEIEYEDFTIKYIAKQVNETELESELFFPN